MSQLLQQFREKVATLTASAKKTPVMNLVWIGAVVLGGILVLRWVMARNAAKKEAESTAVPQSSVMGVASTMPAYGQYQSDQPVLPAAAYEQAFPEAQGLTYKGAIPPAPLCETCKKGVCECWKAQIAAETCGQVIGCMNSESFNYSPNATIPCTDCCVPKVYGCLDPKATNYDPRANTPWQFCTYAQEIPGCTDPSAINYTPSTTVDDGSCVPKVVGCMLPEAINYTGVANTPCDNCCVPRVPGCMLVDSPSYNSDANVEDGSCILPDTRAVLPMARCGDFLTGGTCAPPGDSPMAMEQRSCSPWDIKSHDVVSNGATGW